MSRHKAVIAFIGTILTAVLGVFTPNTIGYNVATFLLALITTVSVYTVPNTMYRQEYGPPRE